MTLLPRAMRDLLDDREGKRAEECILAVILELERAGIHPKAIAKAQTRVLLSFCMEKGREEGNFVWFMRFLSDIGERFEHRAKESRRIWVNKFLEKNGRLYREAAYRIEIKDSTPPEEPHKADLDIIRPYGSA